MRPALFLASLMLLSACAQLGPQPRDDGAAADLDVPWQRHVLDNGLTVILHQDRKAPIVAVNVWYHVGSKDEKPGRTGFAHLFEHLMFQGSENHRDEYFKPLERVGATTINGTTWLDRTNYYQNVPTTALDLALWMESDRMGHFIGIVDQALLDEQRGVVQNEKRQSQNQPYGKVWEALQRSSFPEGHPYRWETIGSMDDLNAASLDDVKEWFASYYGAANATLVIAGDIDPEETLAKVRTYFGDIEPGPPIARRKAWVAKRDASTRETQQDRVAQTRILRAWNVAPVGELELTRLQMAARVLGGGKTSRLYKRLAYDEQLVDSVSAFVLPFELASVFVIQADVKSGVDADRVEALISEQLQALIDKGPRADELARVATDIEAGFVRGLERVGGWGSKSDLLARNQVYLGDPDAWKASLAEIRAADPRRVQQAAAKWLASGDHTIRVEPFPEFSAADDGVDRSDGPPVVETFPSLDFPAIERAELANGMKLVLARRPQTPVVELQMQFDAGYAADAGALPGTASVTMAMLDEGTATRSALEIADRAERLGANIATGSSLDSSYASLSALKRQLRPSMELLADLVRNPAFSDKEFRRVQATWLAGIAQEKTRPVSMALRELPPLLYGEDHAYGIPFTGSGTEDSIRALDTATLREFHRRWIRPDNVTVIVTGDTTMDEIRAELERSFGDWQAPAEPVPEKSLPTVALPEQSRIYLIHRGDAEQSIIIGGHLIPGTGDPDQLLFASANDVIGGSFTARINMNLREDKHWSYGARTVVPSALGQRPMMAYAPVQTDKTAESLAELVRELREFVGAKPARADELDRVKAAEIRSLPGRFETNSAVLGALSGIVRYERPDNYIETLKPRIEAQTVDQVNALARRWYHPEQMTWIIVGDLSKIEQSVRELDLAPVTVLETGR